MRKPSLSGCFGTGILIFCEIGYYYLFTHKGGLSNEATLLILLAANVAGLVGGRKVSNKLLAP